MGRKNAEVFDEIDVGEHFDNYLGTATVGEGGQLLQIVRGMMVETCCAPCCFTNS
jgi:hypothetical protein